MSNRKSTFFYGVLIALTSLVVGMVIASRLDLAPMSLAGALDVPATNSEPLTGPLDASTFRNIAQEAGPTVVRIRVRSERRVAAGSIEEFFGFQGPNGRRGQQPPRVVPQIGSGSGFIIDKSGYILTNNHVVEGAVDIEVGLAGMDDLDAWLPAKIVGTDLLTDSALLQLTKLPAEPLAVSRFGDSSQLASGDWVMAIGSPFALSNSVTVGVVSAVGRPQQTAVSQRFEEMIQTDAAINRGNSGGPLLNIRGEVVGMNTMIVSDESGGFLGIGFSVPINTIRDLLPQLKKGKVVRGRIGVQVLRYPITSEDAADLGLPRAGGAEISVVDEGPAKTAGFKVGDVVIEYNGQPVKSSDELVGMVVRTAPGTTVPLRIVRDRKPMTLNVTVAELDIAEEQAQVSVAPVQREQEQPRETGGFGMTIDNLTPSIARQLGAPSSVRGAVVTDVEAASAAAQSGLRRGDVIIAVSGQAVTSADQAGAALDRVAVGRNARLTVWRDGREQLVLVRKR